MTPQVVLIGLPGAGKSTTGRRLAKILAVPFADSDKLVEEREQASIPELFEARGEQAFRELESAVIAAALGSFNGVLSLGGGALTHPDTRRALTVSGVPVVYLRATLDQLSQRVGDGHTRPLLAGNSDARLAVLSAERASTYEKLATITVDTDQRTPGQVAATVAARLHDRRPGR
jgi:shikimate kinase